MTLGRYLRCALVLSLTSCSAISDFEFSFVQRLDGGMDAGSSPLADGGDIDAQIVPGGPDASGTDASRDALPPDGTLTCQDGSCCESSETTERTCEGGGDEDCDGLADCSDSDCRQTLHCCPTPSVESGDKACTDGIDNDCDGFLDCAELGCGKVYGCTCVRRGPEDESAPAACLDGLDNDCDQLSDCDDPSCSYVQPACCTKSPVGSVSETGAACSDGINNDCDREGADCADSDCQMSTDSGATALESGAACTNGRDDDCDGLKDCKDEDCRAALECCVVDEAVEKSCSDGVNNDCDLSGADCFDPDCQLDPACCKAPVGGESDARLCANGRDDDCDDLIDCADPQCSGTYDCCVAHLRKNREPLTSNEVGLCYDAFDNDCDGALNCWDSDCGGIKNCSVIVRPSPYEPTPIATQ